MPLLQMSLLDNATISRTAERAVIDFEVSQTGKTQEGTSKQVTDTAQKLQVMLKPLGPANTSEEAKASSAITLWTMESLRTSSYDAVTSRKKDPQIVFTASVEFNIRVRDFEKLGMLASKLSQMPLVKLQRID